MGEGLSRGSGEGAHLREARGSGNAALGLGEGGSRREADDVSGRLGHQVTEAAVSPEAGSAVSLLADRRRSGACRKGAEEQGGQEQAEGMGMKAPRVGLVEGAGKAETLRCQGGEQCNGR